MATVLAPLPTSPDGVTADATGQAGALSDWYATADGTWRPSTCPSGWRRRGRRNLNPTSHTTWPAGFRPAGLHVVDGACHQPRWDKPRAGGAVTQTGRTRKTAAATAGDQNLFRLHRKAP